MMVVLVLLVPLFHEPCGVVPQQCRHQPQLNWQPREARAFPAGSQQARREIFRSTRPVKTPAVPSTLRSSQFFRCDRQSHPPGLLGIVSAQKQ
ncbi:hypothetical protein B0T18DRAFT_190401 [Schizothecium vesticola]|uniref:Secreted protein n=1 Tax=Schizothecium vesticola TaxID=314040 RepID=A0AA40K2Q9_9PEZI|nr:hypothetical protein B0T18DRAFT_190401 [Schizothecium vesticola]